MDYGCRNKEVVVMLCLIGLCITKSCFVKPPTHTQCSFRALIVSHGASASVCIVAAVVPLHGIVWTKLAGHQRTGP